MVAATIALAAGCKPPKPASELLQMNIELVTKQELKRIDLHAYRVAMMLIDEPIWQGEAVGYNREHLLEQREYYRSQFRWRMIRDWLASLYEPGSDLALVRTYEFETLSELCAFLDCDPETAGIPVVEEIKEQCRDFEPVLWPPERVRFISRQLPSHFSAAIWPLIAKREERGEEWTGLELSEEAGVVDRWAVGYVTSRRMVYGTLILRVRGLWVLWPPVR